jgi:hypothetical protein
MIPQIAPLDAARTAQARRPYQPDFRIFARIFAR